MVMAEIKVPKPPRKAFNPNRPASDLLRHQVNHLEWAVRHAGERRAGYKVKRVKTEADAAARMAALIPRLESAGSLPFTTSEIPDDDARPPKPTRSRARKRAKRSSRPKVKAKTKAKANAKAKR
jgi:hypothetical protein